MIFKECAPVYWAAGLPVIPLRGKAPFIDDWNQYGSAMPSAAVQDHWVAQYGNSNIGLPFGPCSGLCAIDIDSLLPAEVAAIESVLPRSPWVRVGKKGKGLIFKWQGQKNFKLRDHENRGIVEFLGLGNQMVMPPSIHPDTGRPYTSDTNLWEVLGKIQPLGPDVEDRIRGALEAIGVKLSRGGRSAPLDVVPAGERDNQLVRHAGYLARVVMGIDKSVRWSLAAAMEHMRTWVRDYTAVVAGDAMDPEKGVGKLLEFLVRDLDGGRTLPEGWDADLTPEQRSHPTIAALVARNASARWTFSKARDWIAAKVAENSSDDEWVLARINELVGLVAADENFSETDFRVLVPHLTRASGEMGMKKSDLLQAFKRERKGGDGDIAADHEAIAVQVIEEISRVGELVYDQGYFWQWNGSCHERLERDAVHLQVAEGVKGNPLCRTHSQYTAVVGEIQVKVTKPLQVSFEAGVNFANGFLTTSGELLDHDPKYGKTFTLPFNYAPEKAREAVQWLAYLHQTWGDDPDCEDKIRALQEAFAVTMFGLAVDYQRVILLYGKAGSGKSQALEVLRALMPPSTVSSLPPEQWGQRFALSGLVGKVLNICGELPDRAMIDGQAFKGVVAGDVINTEFKGRDGFSFKPVSAHWFAANDLPRSSDTSEGFTRRWLILEFNRVVPEADRVVDFARGVVADEREAIAAWAVEGLGRLIANRGYTLPASHVARLNQVRRSNNSVLAFLQSTIKIGRDPGGFGDLRDIFDEYLFHMREVSRGGGVGYERFATMLRQLNYEVEEVADSHGVMGYQVRGLQRRMGGGGAGLRLAA